MYHRSCFCTTKRLQLKGISLDDKTVWLSLVTWRTTMIAAAYHKGRGKPKNRVISTNKFMFMDELPGSVGTSASFSLRLGQTLFSSASLLFMSLGVEFYSYTAFWYFFFSFMLSLFVGVIDLTWLCCFPFSKLTYTSLPEMLQSFYFLSSLMRPFLSYISDSWFINHLAWS